MQLNMNVGLGPVKATSCGKRKREVFEERDKCKSFKDFTISSENSSNIDKHPWYNLPDNNQVDQILAAKDSIGCRYLKYDPNTAQEEARKKKRNRMIPLQYRNKPRNSPSRSEEGPPKKKQRTTGPTEISSEELTRKQKQVSDNNIKI